MPPRATAKKTPIEDLELDELKDVSIQQRFLQRAAAKIKKKYPDAEHRTGNDPGKPPSYLHMPDLGLQSALGRPGYAMGKIGCIMAEEGAGKTSKVMSMMNQIDLQGGLCGMVEWEKVTAQEHLASYVQRPENIAWERPGSLKEGLDYIRIMLRQFAEDDPEGLLPKLIVGDSLGGSVTDRTLEEDHEYGDQRVGGTGLILSDAIPHFQHLAEQTNTLVVFVNQARVIIETGFGGAPKPWYDKLTAKGGKAVPFAATYWELLRKGGMVTSGSGETKSRDGFTVTSFFKKNKMRVPFREYKFDVTWGNDLDYSPHTMDQLALDQVLGMKVKARRYWCPDIGVKETDKLNDRDMYDLIHNTPEIKERFQIVLGIVTDPNAADEPEVTEEA